MIDEIKNIFFIEQDKEITFIQLAESPSCKNHLKTMGDVGKQITKIKRIECVSHQLVLDDVAVDPTILGLKMKIIRTEINNFIYDKITTRLAESVFGDKP